MEGTDPRKEIWEIPLAAIKEALTNAICHRDYYETGGTITVELYDDRLEISNPGGLLPEVAKSFGHRSLSRNPKIFELFTRLNLVEKVGSGIPRMVKEMATARLPRPYFVTEGMFTTILSKRESVLCREKSKEKSKEKTSEKVLRLIATDSHISMAALAKECGVTEQAIYKIIRRFREDNTLIRKGADKGGEWIIIK